jgi:cytochrome c oxidase assembly protein subunit 15
LGVVHLVLLQVTLGISTLIYLVPVPLAAAHQAGALALLTGTLVLGSRVWVPRRLMALVRQRVRQASAVTGAGKVGLGKEAMKSDLSALRRNGPPVL